MSDPHHFWLRLKRRTFAFIRIFAKSRFIVVSEFMTFGFTQIYSSLSTGKHLFSEKVCGSTSSLVVELPWRILSIKSRSQTEWIVHIEAKSHRVPPKPHHQPSNSRTNEQLFHWKKSLEQSAAGKALQHFPTAALLFKLKR